MRNVQALADHRKVVSGPFRDEIRVKPHPEKEVLHCSKAHIRKRKQPILVLGLL